MWTWTCSRCGEKFTHAEKADAQAEFNQHAVDVHGAKVVISVEAGER